MTNINCEVVIRCRLLSGQAYDSRMGLTIRANSDIIYQSQELTNDTVDLEFSHSLPLTVQFCVHGKIPEQTEVDHLGNVVRDKCVILDGFCINKMWVKKWMLENKLVQYFPDNGKPRINNYFGQDGVASVILPYDNLLEFWLDLLTVDQ